MIAAWIPLSPTSSKEVGDHVAFFLVAFGTDIGCYIESCPWSASLSV